MLFRAIDVSMIRWLVLVVRACHFGVLESLVAGFGPLATESQPRTRHGFVPFIVEQLLWRRIAI